jgi:hypothetical protein
VGRTGLREVETQQERVSFVWCPPPLTGGHTDSFRAAYFSKDINESCEAFSAWEGKGRRGLLAEYESEGVDEGSNELF